MDESLVEDRAYALRGQKVYATRCGNRKKFNRKSLIAVHTPQQKNLLVAPFLYEGTMNTELFLYYLEHVLLPQLGRGKTLIMDNASFHKSLKIKELVERFGSKVLFLSPYSPDLNPIEHCWSIVKNKIKTLLRKGSGTVYEACLNVLRTVACHYE